MSFGEVGQAKSVVIVDFVDHAPTVVRLAEIPRTRKLVQLKGAPEGIEAQLREHLNSGLSVWVDIQVTEGEGELDPCWAKFTAMVEGSAVRLLRWRNLRPGKNGSALAAAVLAEAKLEFLTPRELFAMRIQDEELSDEEKRVYTALFDEIVVSAGEADPRKD
jgi:exonuclease SbcD